MPRDLTTIKKLWSGDYLATPLSRIFLDNLPVAQLLNELESESSRPLTQDRATGRRVNWNQGTSSDYV